MSQQVVECLLMNKKSPEEMLFWQSHYITHLVGAILGVLPAQGLPEEMIEEFKAEARVYADAEFSKLDLQDPQ